MSDEASTPLRPRAALGRRPPPPLPARANRQPGPLSPARRVAPPRVVSVLWIVFRNTSFQGRSEFRVWAESRRCRPPPPRPSPRVVSARAPTVAPPKSPARHTSSRHRAFVAPRCRFSPGATHSRDAPKTPGALAAVPRLGTARRPSRRRHDPARRTPTRCVGAHLDGPCEWRVAARTRDGESRAAKKITIGPRSPVASDAGPRPIRSPGPGAMPAPRRDGRAAATGGGSHGTTGGGADANSSPRAKGGRTYAGRRPTGCFAGGDGRESRRTADGGRRRREGGTRETESVGTIKKRAHDDLFL